VGEDYAVSTIECMSEVGSGALPLQTLASAGIAITPAARRGVGRKLEALSRAFRRLPVPVIGYVRDNALIFDLRCLDDETAFIAQLAGLRAELPAGEA
jgi:L-seryl-tRNA(Ser) seleniumtransferase